MAQAITDQDSNAILAQLEKSNLFLIPLDRDHEWYRYHHLFGSFLLNRLQKLQPDAIPDLHALASHWFETKGMTDEAIHHALAAQLYERAGQLIEKVALAVILGGKLQNVQRWLDSLPVKVVEERPILLIIHAWLYLLGGLLKRSAVYVARAEAIISQGPSKAESAAQLEEWKTALLVVRATLATRSEDAPATIALAAQVLERLSVEESGLRSLMALDLGNAYLINGEMQTGRLAFNQALAASRYAPNLLIYLIIVARLSYLERESGRLQYSAQIQYEALAVVKEQWGIHADSTYRYPAVCMVYTSLAALLFEWNRLSEVSRLLEVSLELNRYFANPELELGCYVLGSYISQAQGQPAQARRYLNQADYLRQHHRMEGKFAFLIRAWDIHLSLLNGQAGQARYLADAVGLNTDQSPSYRFQDEQIGLARLLMVEGRLDEAAAWLTKLEEFASTGGHIAKLLRIRLLQALLYADRGKITAALDKLQTVLIQAATEGFIRLFLDEGLPAWKLLQRLQQTGLSYPTTYLETVLAAFENVAVKVSPGAHLFSLPDNLVTLGLQPLTDDLPTSPELSLRESQVLQLLATGQPNTVIAGQLVISLATLKSHLHRIYRKLQVSNRRQALQAARKAGLLLNAVD